MNKRDFLKFAGGSLLIPIIPSTALAGTPTDLKEWFETNFNCKQGDQSAKTKVGNKYFTYSTFAAGVFDLPKEEAKKRLTRYFVDHFAPLAAGKPDLFWRVEPRFESDTVTEYGKTWMTSEEAEDGGVRGGKFYKAIYRKVDPKRQSSVKWEEVNKPADVELEFETGAYKYVLAKHTLHKMRFRLVIPTQAEQLETFAHIEGNIPRKI